MSTTGSSPISGGSSEDRILTAVAELGTATAAAIAEVTDVAYSTTTAKLRALHAAGRVTKTRAPDGRISWQPTPAAGSADPSGGAAPGQSKPVPAGADRTAQTTAGAAKPSTRSGNNTTGRNKPTQTAATNTDPAAPDSAVTAAAAPPSTPAPDNGESSAGSTPRRAKGALRAEVLAVLQDHPDQVFKVSQVCKQLPGASAGAIANALYKLAADGNARQVADKPAAYQAE